MSQCITIRAIEVTREYAPSLVAEKVRYRRKFTNVFSGSLAFVELFGYGLYQQPLRLDFGNLNVTVWITVEQQLLLNLSRQIVK